MPNRPSRKNLGLLAISISFSVLLFLTANSALYSHSGTHINRLTETYTHTLENVPIDIKYNNEEYFISGYSYDVEVYLSSTNRIKLDTEINADTRNFKVVADLTKLSEGTTKIPLEIKDLPSDVTADLRPDSMEFTLGKKATKSFPIQLEVDDNQVATGYTITGSELELDSAEVTSDEATIELIDHLVAKLPSDTVLNRDYQDSVILQAVSGTGTVLPGVISPSRVEAEISLKKLTKTVPVAVELIGELDSSLDNINYELGLTEVVVSGSQEALDATDFVSLRLDISDIRRDMRKTVSLSSPNVTVTPEVIDVKFTVKKKD